MNARKRILVSMSLAATPRSVESALAQLWPREAAEVTGLFIEDLDVLNLSRLRVSREIRYGESASRIPDADDMERQIQAHGRRVQAAFERAARALNVLASFRVARGPLASCLLEACADVDVLVVAGARDWMGQRLSLGKQLPQLLASGPRTLVIVQEAPRTGGIAVVYHDTDSGRAALEMAADIANSQGLALHVLLAATESEEVVKLREAVQARLGGHPAASYLPLAKDGNADQIARAAARVSARLLILPRDAADVSRESAADIVERVGCSVILTG